MEQNNWEKSTYDLLDMFASIKEIGIVNDVTRVEKILIDFLAKAEEYFLIYQFLSKSITFSYVEKYQTTKSIFVTRAALIDKNSMLNNPINTVLNKSNQQQKKVFFQFIDELSLIEEEYNFNKENERKVKHIETAYQISIKKAVNNFEEREEIFKQEYNKQVAHMESKITLLEKTTKKNLDKMNTTAITILGLFTSIVFAVFGGVSMIDAVFTRLNDTSNISILMLILSWSLILIFVVLIINFLLVSISHIVGKNSIEDKYRVNFLLFKNKVSYARAITYNGIFLAVIVFIVLNMIRIHSDWEEVIVYIIGGISIVSFIFYIVIFFIAKSREKTDAV